MAKITEQEKEKLIVGYMAATGASRLKAEFMVDIGLGIVESDVVELEAEGE